MVIIGVGLVGGSLGLKCRQEGLAKEVVGVGRGVKNLENAISLGAIDCYSHNAVRAVQGADLVVLATPIGCFRSIVEEIRSSLTNGAIVTDVGSVKGELVGTLEDLMPSGTHFVGAHPIAGKEKSGSAYADPDLFKDAWCVITPTARTEVNALNSVTNLWEKAGAKVTYMDPYEHDAILAHTSHLPHILAFSLVATLEDVSRHNPKALSYCGKGFKDTSRLGSSSPEMWRDICLHNREQLLIAIKRFQGSLRKIETRIIQGDGAALMGMFKKAKSFRDRL